MPHDEYDWDEMAREEEEASPVPWVKYFLILALLIGLAVLYDHAWPAI